MKRYLLFIATLSSCANHSTNIHNSQVDAINKEYGEMLVFWNTACEKWQDRKGPFIHAKCIEPVSTEIEARINARINACLKKNDKSCASYITSLVDQKIAKIRLQYPMGSLEWAQTKCTAEGDCKNPFSLEYYLMESHNRAVVEAYKNAMNGENYRYLSDYQLERQQRINEFTGFSNQSRSVICTSQRFGDQIQTNCR